MLRLWLLGLLAVSFVGAGWGHESFQTSPEFLSNQARIYQLLFHVAQPEVVNPRLHEQGEKYFHANYHKFKDPNVVERFKELKLRETLPRRAVFSVYDDSHLAQLKALTELLISADSFDSFFNTALWARGTENEGVFVFALYTAVIHRPDTAYIRLPPLYELYPYAFYNADVIKAINDYKITHPFDRSNPTVVAFAANYTGWNVNRQTSLENKLNYFVEDIGLNAYYVFLRLNNPFWLSSDVLDTSAYRGEEYLYAHIQLLRRYNLERVANQLPFVENFLWTEPFPVGYEPTLVYHNGIPWPQRLAYSKLPRSSYKDVIDIIDLETRIRTAIDSGFVLDNHNKWVNIYTPEGLNILGNIIEGNADSINKNVYGSFDELSRKILGHSTTPVADATVVPSALETFTSSLRDPATYRILKRVNDLYTRYKLRQNTHKSNEGLLTSRPGRTFHRKVNDTTYPKIESVDVTRLTTFFDVFNSTVSNGLLIQSDEEAKTNLIKITQTRLNHESFKYTIQVTSKKPTKAVVKVFLGPKTDAYHNLIKLPQDFDYFYEIDDWLVSLQEGTNTIVRSSNDSFFYYPDFEPSEVYYARVQEAIRRDTPLYLEKRIAGFPQRLLLPKGDVAGKLYQLFVYISPVEDDAEVNYHSRVFGNTLFDKNSLGFPLDRLVTESKFRQQNWILQDVTIYHHPETINEVNPYCTTTPHVFGTTRVVC
ncbi:hexamerin 70a-like [Megalopta genalis]|uniref:hexamerin 70a-like n=1 Tax=Megalopta genalis TaxID=115081 RepID=UPI003FD36584